MTVVSVEIPDLESLKCTDESSDCLCTRKKGDAPQFGPQSYGEKPEKGN